MSEGKPYQFRSLSADGIDAERRAEGLHRMHSAERPHYSYPLPIEFKEKDFTTIWTYADEVSEQSHAFQLQIMSPHSASTLERSQLEVAEAFSKKSDLTRPSTEGIGKPLLPLFDPETSLLYGPAEPRVNPHVQRVQDAVSIVSNFRDGSLRHLDKDTVDREVALAIQATIHSPAAREHIRFLLSGLMKEVVLLELFMHRLPDQDFTVQGPSVVDRRTETVIEHRLLLLEQQKLNPYYLAQAREILPRYQDAAIQMLGGVRQMFQAASQRRTLEREIAAVRTLARTMRTNKVDFLQAAAVIRIITAHPITELIGDE